MAGDSTKHPAAEPRQSYGTARKPSTGNRGFSNTPLSPKHRRMLLEESGISPEIADERGYWTATSRSELPEAFKRYQRRAPALVLHTYSSDGETTGCQIRPDNPRRDKKGEPIKYESAGGSRMILDVHPRNMEAVRDPGADLWVTEGVKKGDSLASRGLCAISLIGVWGWCVPKTKSKELLPCWDHGALDGRRVYVVFDSDAMEKENVQLALERFVATLEARGADVWIVYLPGGPASKKVGADDFLVAGGTIAELKALGRRFEPRDLGRVRLSRDGKLRAAVAGLWGKFWGFEWGRLVGTGERPNSMRGHSCRDAAKVAIDHATKSGKVVEDGVRFTLAQRPWALKAKISRCTLVKVVAHLEAEGWLRRDCDGWAADAPGSYVLLAPSRRATLHQEGVRENEEGGREVCDPGGEELRSLRGPYDR